MQAIIITIIIVLAVIAGAVYYYYTSRVPTGPIKDKILVGFSISLTGKWSAAGKQIFDGYKLIVDEINRLGGVYVAELNTYLPIQLIYYDDSSDATKAVTNYEKLITVDGVDFCLAPYGSVISDAIAPVVERYRVPTMITSTWESTYNKGYRHIFGVFTTGSWWMHFIDFLNDKLNDPNLPEEQKPRRIAIQVDDDPGGRDMLDFYPNYLRQKGFNVVYASVNPVGTTDYTPYIIAIQAAKADVLLHLGRMDESTALMRNLAELGVNFKAIFCTVGPTLEAWMELGPAGYYVFSYSPYWSPQLDWSATYLKSGLKWNNLEMASKFEERTGQKMDWRAFNAVLHVLVLADSIERAGSLNREKVRDAIASTKLPIPGGYYAFDEKGRVDPRYYPTCVVQVFPEGPLIVYPKEFAVREPVYPRP